MRYAALLLIALALSGCAVYEDEAERAYTHDSLGIPAAFTTGDVRIITERQHPVTHQQVVCTEPSPDIAKAVSASFFSNIQYNGGTGSPNGSGSLSGASAEAVAELAGRTTALLGLRDGLFQACQAYANGAIGADMYALIVSHYGQLMTTLFLGQDIAGAVTSANKTSSPQISASQNAPSSQSNTPSSNNSPSGSDSSSPSSNSGANQNATQPTVSQATPPTATPATGAAAALARINEDYFNIDYNFIHMLAVVCINQNDPTVEAPLNPNDTAAKYRQMNPWLNLVCPEIKQALGPSGTKAFVENAKQLVAGRVLAPPVDPTTTTGTTSTAAAKTPAASTASSGKAKNTAPTCTAMTTAIKAQIIQVLQAQKYLTDDNYSPALNAFETDYGLGETSCPTNQVGQKTLTVIQALAAAEKKK